MERMIQYYVLFIAILKSFVADTFRRLSIRYIRSVQEWTAELRLPGTLFVRIVGAVSALVSGIFALNIKNRILCYYKWRTKSVRYNFGKYIAYDSF